MEVKTAGILIIGDEILKGEVLECNAPFICGHLRQMGIRVSKISVISDDIDEIATNVSEFSKKFNFVITTGGIGPTHDDVTYEGVGKAFKELLVCNEDLLKYWDKIFSRTGWGISSDTWKRMADIPASGKVVFFSSSQKSDVEYECVVIVSNVFILPGVPSLVKRIFPQVASKFFVSGNIFYSEVIYLRKDEELAMQYLNPVVDQFKDKVTFGSYPVFFNPIYNAKITIESTSHQFFKDAVNTLKSRIPKEWQVCDLEVAAENIQNSIRLFPFISKSVEILDKCFKKYQLPQVAVAFNGGKDCTALLFLVYAYCQYKSIDVSAKKLQAVFFYNNDVFQEVDKFVQESVERYDMKLSIVKGEIKSALGQTLKDHPQWEAILMGTRHSDPHSARLEAFQMTDESWPKVMRVNPILHWSYDDVWFFLRYLHVPYCSLYDEGYTSLGNGSNTNKNPDLQFLDENNTVRYYPAFKLKDCNKERNGRS